MLRFFETSTRNLLAYGAAARVGHYVALSVVGTERLLERGYSRAKLAQENLIKASSIPYSIVRATQFFEFRKADCGLFRRREQGTPASRAHPADVASALATIATSSPVNSTVGNPGPEQFRLDELVRRDLAAFQDPREVLSHPPGRHYGIQVSERSLVPDNDARLGEARFEDWLIHATKPAPKAGV